MASYQEDIASKLLHSSDARIAEAAKRVFSSTPPAAASLVALSSAPSSAVTCAFDEESIHAPMIDESGRYHAGMGIPPHRGAEHTADISSGAAVDAALNDEDTEVAEGSEKKPSSTERLKRR